MNTDENGRIIFGEQALVEGDEFWQDGSGNKILPLGTLVVQEVKASEGYLVNSERLIRVLNVEMNNKDAGMVSAVASAEEIIKGNVKITKFYSEDGQHVPMEGIVFVLTSKTNGQEYTIVTDQYGEASTVELGGLPYDTYSVTEENTPDGYFACDSFEVTIKEDQQMEVFEIENKPIPVEKSEVVKTGDTSQGMIYAGLMILALAAVTAMQKNKIKNGTYK